MLGGRSERVRARFPKFLRVRAKFQPAQDFSSYLPPQRLAFNLQALRRARLPTSRTKFCCSRILPALNHSPSANAFYQRSVLSLIAHIRLGAGKCLGVRRIFVRILPHLLEKNSKKSDLSWRWSAYIEYSIAESSNRSICYKSLRIRWTHCYKNLKGSLCIYWLENLIS